MTVSAAPAPPRVRLLPVRPYEPPYDDERSDHAAPLPPSIGVQGSLALQLVPSRRVVPALRLVDPPVPDAADAADEPDTPRPTPTCELPAIAPWAHRLVIGVLEVLTGTRPVGQLERLTSDRVFGDLQRAATARAGSRKLSAAGARSVRSIRVSEPRDGVAEVSAVVRAGERCRALALRIEGLDGRWRCTALQVG